MCQGVKTIYHCLSNIRILSLILMAHVILLLLIT